MNLIYFQGQINSARYLVLYLYFNKLTRKKLGNKLNSTAMQNWKSCG